MNVDVGAAGRGTYRCLDEMCGIREDVTVEGRALERSSGNEAAQDRTVSGARSVAIFIVNRSLAV